MKHKKNNNKKKLHVMFSTGQYRSTEKGYEQFCQVSENIICSDSILTKLFY